MLRPDFTEMFEVLSPDKSANGSKLELMGVTMDDFPLLLIALIAAAAIGIIFV